LSERVAQTDSSESTPPLAVIRALAELCRREGVEELEAEDGTWTIRLQVDLSIPLAQPANSVAEIDHATEVPFVQHSQWVGVFHRAAVVGMAPYAREDQVLKQGDVLGVIIAMQLQHEVAAAKAGTLLRFLVEDGSAVEYGQPLLEIE
jgi:acetyl-CoA carboxylase biotin carboxyl carrier protein